MERVFAVLLAVVLAVSLPAGCGGSSSAGSAGEPLLIKAFLKQA